jgi:hypothetical protein
MTRVVGHVLYWACCVISALLISLVTAVAAIEPVGRDPVNFFIVGVLAIGLWSTGQICRYAMAGR